LISSNLNKSLPRKIKEIVFKWVILRVPFDLPLTITVYSRVSRALQTAGTLQVKLGWHPDERGGKGKEREGRGTDVGQNRERGTSEWGRERAKEEISKQSEEEEEQANEKEEEELATQFEEEEGNEKEEEEIATQSQEEIATQSEVEQEHANDIATKRKR
jgi:hypothetical protein